MTQKDVPRRRYFILLGCLAILVLHSLAANADGVPPAQAATCLACHGNGMQRPGDPAVPIIAGQQYQYLLSALSAYQAGARTDDRAAVMAAMVKGLSAADIKTVAGFFAELRPVRW